MQSLQGTVRRHLTVDQEGKVENILHQERHHPIRPHLQIPVQSVHLLFILGTINMKYQYNHDQISTQRVHLHILHMVIDLKVLVRSFNCESRACYVGNPRESFFFEFAKVKFYFAKVSRKLGIIIIICKGLPPTAARGPAGKGHQRMRVAVAKFPKVRLCESQTPRPLVFAFPSVHPLLMAGVCE